MAVTRSGAAWTPRTHGQPLPGLPCKEGAVPPYTGARLSEAQGPHPYPCPPSRAEPRATSGLFLPFFPLSPGQDRGGRSGWHVTVSTSLSVGKGPSARRGRAAPLCSEPQRGSEPGPRTICRSHTAAPRPLCNWRLSLCLELCVPTPWHSSRRSDTTCPRWAGAKNRPGVSLGCGHLVAWLPKVLSLLMGSPQTTGPASYSHGLWAWPQPVQMG